MKSTIHRLVCTGTPGGWCAGPGLNLPPCVFCISFPQLTQWPGFSPLLCITFTTSSPKLSWTWVAGRCKPLTPTHYFHPPHKDQSVRL